MDDRELRWLWNTFKFIAKAALVTRAWVPALASWLFAIVNPTGFSILFWGLIVLLSYAYMLAFWIKDGIRKVQKDP